MPEVKKRTAGALFIAVVMIAITSIIKSRVENWHPDDLMNQNIRYYSLLILDTTKSISTAIVVPWVMLYITTLQELAEQYVDLWVDFFNAMMDVGSIVPDDITAFGGKRR